MDAAQDSTSFLTFHVSGRRYALAAESVGEVIPMPQVVRVPQAPPALLGLANLRGSVLPVASTRALLGMEGDGGAGLSRTIVLHAQFPVGLAVDGVDRLVTVQAEGVESNPAHLGAEHDEKITGAFRDGDSIVRVLDVDQLLDTAFAERSVPVRVSGQSGMTIPRQADESTAEQDLLMTFDVAEQEFALDLDAVEEVVSKPDHVSAVPRSDAPVLGMMSLRDRLLPILSLRALLGFAPAASDETREKIVVARVHGALVGFVADRVRAVISMERDRIDPVPPVLAARTGGEARIRAVWRGHDGRRLVSILASDRLFREDIMQRLREGHQMRDADISSNLQAHEEHKFLIFRLGENEFGLPVSAVDEVAPVPDRITRVPKTPKFLEGVVNLRGNVLPVVDQRRRFDLPPLENTTNRRLVVVRTEQHRAGLIVDSVSEVLRTSADRIDAAPELSRDVSRLVKGVVNLERDGRMVLLLDPAELLTRAERGLLDAFEGKSQAPS